RSTRATQKGDPPMQLQLDPHWRPATQQQVFRRLMQAMAYPGTIVDLAFAGPARASLAALATLLDHTTTLCDLDEVLAERDRRFLEARSAPHDDADYILALAQPRPEADMAPQLGTLAGPDQSATLVLDGEQIGAGDLLLELRGPGIQTAVRVALTGFHRDWFERRAAWTAHFPLGVDLLLADARRVLAIPRTTQVAFYENGRTKG
ncbi:MAG: phosphonate C-P lyase system protein PhnH, partial [Chloroflexales bacterium]|nr:phosphonate C-P lyase system protein PhnH [Chloroflexales bacterium]